MSGGRPWSDDEGDRLLELAGTVPLAEIAGRLGRSRQACALWLYKRHVGVRTAGELVTAPACARLYQVPISRVYRLIRQGRLKARRSGGGWLIDPEAAKRCAELQAPKRTHRDRPPDVGDYWQRYGYVRRSDRRSP